MANWPIDPAAVPNGADYAPVAHTHVATDVTDFAEAVDDRVAALLVAGSNVTLTYNDAANTLTVAASSGGGGVSDGDKGDITVSGTGTIWTVDNAAITYAKLQDVSVTDTVLGRATAGAGVVEEIACTSQARQLLDDASFAAMRSTLQLGTLATQNAVDLGVPGQVTGRLLYTNLTQSVAASKLLGRGSASGAGDWQDITLGTNLSMSGTTLNATGGGGGLSDGDYGDITVGGVGTTMTIDANVVTYAKLQDAAAGNVVLCRAAATAGDYSEVPLAASRLLGRGSTGDVAAISIGSGLGLSGTTLAASLSNETKNLGADVALSSSNTWTQALETTGAFGQGVYLVMGTVTFNRAATTARTYQAKLQNDQVSPTTYASTSLYMPSVNPSSSSLSLHAIVTVPALGSYKFRLYGLSSAGSASDLMKAALATNGVGNNATTLTVVRIA